MTVNFRLATEAETDLVAEIHRRAFGQDEEADLTRALLDDPTAQQYYSILAFEGDRPAGHILFSSVAVEPDAGITASILCPLAVAPDQQAKGVGSGLIRDGLERLTADGCDLVFVLGDPGYYGRFGFAACPAGLDAPFPLSSMYQAGWMCQALSDKGAAARGTVRCADVLNQPEFWTE